MPVFSRNRDVKKNVDSSTKWVKFLESQKSKNILENTSKKVRTQLIQEIQPYNDQLLLTLPNSHQP